MENFMKFIKLSVASTICLAMTSPAVLAQTAETEAVEAAQSSATVADIVVTAQRRQESAQTVPIAISAFSGAQLDSLGLNEASSLGNIVPGLVVNHNTGLGSANAYYMRGLGNAESIATFDPPVGSYIDDVYISRQNANNFNLFDVQRIEVLRGPQGTLFGRNTTGGAVNIIMQEPATDFGGYVEAGIGAYDQTEFRASVDLPITDTFRTKVSAYKLDGGDYAKNTTTGQRANGNSGWGARLGTVWEIAPNVKWTGSYTHLFVDSEYLPNFKCDPNNPSDCDGRFVSTGLILGGTAKTEQYPDYGVTGRKARFMGGARSDSDLITSNLAIDLNSDTTLNLITGYSRLNQRFALDYTDGRNSASLNTPSTVPQGYSPGGFALLNDATTKQFSQEAKVSGNLGDGLFDYVTGLYYMNEKSSTDFADLLGIFATPDLAGSAVTPLLLADRLMKNDTETVAAYFQGDLNVTSQLKLTAGIRYTDEKKTFSIYDNRASCNNGPLDLTCLSNDTFIAANGTPIPREMNAGVWTPRFAVNFQANRNLLVYASATRGFKSGGWNARGTTSSNLLPFGRETIWSYETGFKSEFFDRRVRLNVTAFYLNNKDLQTPAGLVADDGSLVSFTRNFSDYVNRGIEAELTVVPTAGLNLYANASFSRDKYKLPKGAPDVDEYGVRSVSAQLAACQADLAANVVPTGTGACGTGIVTADGKIATPQRTPTFTLSAGGSYEFPIGTDGLTLTPAANAYYRSGLEVITSNLNFYTGAISGSNGDFAYNPFGGRIVSGSHSDAVWLFSANVTLRGADDKWSLALSCDNCTNQTRTVASLVNLDYFNAPRTWTLKGRVNF